MTYDYDDFINDCRAALKTGDGPEAREAVRLCLEKLLQNKAFIAEKLGPDAPVGRHTVHREDETGFNLLYHINDEAHVSSPHDHGSSWAIYGQATGYTDMTEWKFDAATQELTKAKQYRLEPGKAGIYEPGAIHSIDFPAGARFVRVTGTDLATVVRRRFDQETGALEQVQAVGADT